MLCRLDKGRKQVRFVSRAMGLGVHDDLVLVIDDSETVVALDNAVRRRQLRAFWVGQIRLLLVAAGAAHLRCLRQEVREFGDLKFQNLNGVLLRPQRLGLSCGGQQQT